MRDDPEAGGNPDTGKPENGFERAILKTVRLALNDYRDTQRIGLLQVRNRILITIMVIEIAAVLILGLAIVAGAGVDQILAATAFFLVGTVLGLLYNRLYTPLETQPVVNEDYGLGRVRLLATPLFSGLAAIAGVLLVMVVPAVVDTGEITSVETTDLGREPGAVTTAQPQVQNTRADSQIPALNQIFSFNSSNFVIAAIFGLSPAYLFARLGQGNKLLANLNSTQPTSRTSA
jgi:hypothetical protein